MVSAAYVCMYVCMYEQCVCVCVCARARMYDGFSFSFTESSCKFHNISYLRNPRNT